MRVRPEEWFKPISKPKKVRVVPRFSVKKPGRRHTFLRKQLYKEGEIELSERLHRMGYNRLHIAETIGTDIVTLKKILRDPYKLTPRHILCLSVLLGEDFLDVLYEVGIECKKKDMYSKEKAAQKRLEKSIEKRPHSSSSEYKGKSLKD